MVLLYRRHDRFLTLLLFFPLQYGTPDDIARARELHLQANYMASALRLDVKELRLPI